MPSAGNLDHRNHLSLPSSEWGYVLAGCIFAIEFSQFTPLDKNAQPPDPEWVAICICAIYTIAAGYFYYCVYRIHRILCDVSSGDYPITPGKSVGFHFIPLFGIYWLFAWTNSIAKFVDSTSSDARMGKGWMGAGLLVAFLLTTVGEPIGIATQFGAFQSLPIKYGRSLMAIAVGGTVGIAAKFGVLQYVTLKLKRALSDEQQETNLAVSPSRLALFTGLGSGFALLGALGVNELFFVKQPQRGYAIYELVAIFIASAGALVFIEPFVKQFKEILGETEEEHLTQQPPRLGWQVIGFAAIAIASLSHTALHTIAAEMVENRSLRQAVIIAFGTLIPAAITRAWVAQIQQGRSAAWAGGCVGAIFAILVILVKTAIRVPITPEPHKVIMAIGSACQYGACGFLGGFVLDRRWASSAIRRLELVFLGVTVAVVAIVVPIDQHISNLHKEPVEILVYFARVVGWVCGISALEPGAEALLRPRPQKLAGV